MKYPPRHVALLAMLLLPAFAAAPPTNTIATNTIAAGGNSEGCDALYAMFLGDWPGEEITVKTLGSGQGKVATVTMIGSSGDLKYSQSASGLRVTLPQSPPCKHAYVLKISGLKMNQEPAGEAARLGNPQ